MAPTPRLLRQCHQASTYLAYFYRATARNLLEVAITHTRPAGQKLAGGRDINLPDSQPPRLSQSSLPVTQHQACPQGQALARPRGGSWQRGSLGHALHSLAMRSPGVRLWACGPTPGAGTRRQGGTGAHAVGGKDSREKWLCISYTARTRSRQPAALRTRHHAVLGRGGAARDTVRASARVSSEAAAHMLLCPALAGTRAHPRRLYEYPARRKQSDPSPFCTAVTRPTFPHHAPVPEVTDGASAVQRAFTERPRLLVVDIDPPGIHGVEVARQVWAMPRT